MNPLKFTFGRFLLTFCILFLFSACHQSASRPLADAPSSSLSSPSATPQPSDQNIPADTAPHETPVRVTTEATASPSPTDSIASSSSSSSEGSGFSANGSTDQDDQDSTIAQRVYEQLPENERELVDNSFDNADVNRIVLNDALFSTGSEMEPGYVGQEVYCISFPTQNQISTIIVYATVDTVEVIGYGLSD